MGVAQTLHKQDRTGTKEGVCVKRYGNKGVLVKLLTSAQVEETDGEGSMLGAIN